MKKEINRNLLPILLTITLIGGIVALPIKANATTEFKDVGASHWAYEAIQSMKEKGLLSGYSDGSFRPNKEVTYGEAIKLAVIAGRGEDNVGIDETYKEYDFLHWSVSYWRAAVDDQLMFSDFVPESETEEAENGSKITHFGEDKAITRADMAYLAANALNAEYILYDDLKDTFSDVSRETCPRYYEILQAYNAGLITGYGDGTFRPDFTLSRAEASAIIYRIINQSQRLTNEVSGTDKPKGKYNWQEGTFGLYREVSVKDYFEEVPSFLNKGTFRGKECNVYMTIARIYKVGQIKIKKRENREKGANIEIHFPQNFDPQAIMLKDGTTIQAQENGDYDYSFNNWRADPFGIIKTSGAIRLQDIKYFFDYENTRKLVYDSDSESGYAEVYILNVCENPFR